MQGVRRPGPNRPAYHAGTAFPGRDPIATGAAARAAAGAVAMIKTRRPRGADPRVWRAVVVLLAVDAWKTPSELAPAAALRPDQVSRALRRRAELGQVERRERHTGRRGRPEIAYRLARAA